MHISVYIIMILASLLSACAAVWYQQSYIDEKLLPPADAFKRNKILFGCSVVLCTGITVTLLILWGRRAVPAYAAVQNLLLWYGVWCAAITDFRVKKIPNTIVLMALGVRCIGILWEILAEKKSIAETLIFGLIGMAFGFFFFLICGLISKGGIGGGDMKLFAAIGLYFGLVGLLQIMIYSMLLSAVVSICLLLSRKAKMKSTVPMAPFILIGLTVYYIFLSNLE
ncbi:MAG: A24 family peptidase [Oscillospiraceae bacterium]|nr:A24 family peptidase [Oscillospiraceae bacterium]